jgi:hypothetical protein
MNLHTKAKKDSKTEQAKLMAMLIKEVVQSVIKKEVQPLIKELKSVKRELNELKKNQSKPIVQEKVTSKQDVVDDLDSLIGNVLEEDRKTTPQQSDKTFSKNPMFNDLIASSGGITESDRKSLNENFRTMMNLNSSDALGFAGQSAPVPPVINEKTNTANIGVNQMAQVANQIGGEQGEALANALTRDYSALVKSFKKK